MTKYSYKWYISISSEWTLRFVAFFPKLECGKWPTYERNMRFVHVALCVFDSSRVESSWTLSLYLSERCLHFTCRRAWQATTQKLEASLSLSLSLLFSLSVSFYAHSPVALVNIFFALAFAKRNESLYTWRVARERRALCMVTHSLSRTHADQCTCHRSRRIPRVAIGETGKKETSPFLSSKLISISATKLCRIFARASTTPTGRWRFDDKSPQFSDHIMSNVNEDAGDDRRAKRRNQERKRKRKRWTETHALSRNIALVGPRRYITRSRD